MVKHFHASGKIAGYEILRGFSLFGEGLKRQVIYDTYRKLVAARDGEIEVHGSGLETRDFIHVSAVVELANRFIDHVPDNSVRNLCTGNGITIRELIAKIQGLAHLEKVRLRFTHAQSPVKHLVGNTDRLKSVIQPESYSLDRKLDSVLRAYSL
jgi:nucleoside-diphosphate-sugar epimerase